MAALGQQQSFNKKQIIPAEGLVFPVLLPLDRQLSALEMTRESAMFRSKKEPGKRNPWNKGKLVGQKAPISMQEVWSIRMRLQTIGNRRDLALFNLAIDSKLRACDLLTLRIADVASGGEVMYRATVRQSKTNRPVRFEISGRTRKSMEDRIETAQLTESAYLFPSRVRHSPHL